MNNNVEFSITCPPETALKKLTKANIAVFKLKKHGSTLTFGVLQEYSEKVFAIFSHPCYNITVKRHSAKTRALTFLKRRFGLVMGAAVFVCAAVVSGNVVMRIKVTGNGSYLSESIISIANECGAREWSLCRKLDAPLLQAKILALPDVNFCSVQREGAYLIIDVRTEEEHTAKVNYQPLKADVSGEVYRIVAICGTAERAQGDKVNAGDILIGAYELTEEGESHPCLAVGFAEITASASLSLYYDKESAENTEEALKAAALYSDRIVSQSYTVAPCDGGVKYDVTFSYIETVAINME
ncbi:MAG: sporulation protein YqfD [Clostridia bacterium]|nr:sporulation protein YqfD [Clostridia bacterium]